MCRPKTTSRHASPLNRSPRDCTADGSCTPDTVPLPPRPDASQVWVSDTDDRSQIHHPSRKVLGSGPRQQDVVISGLTGCIRYPCDQRSRQQQPSAHSPLSLASTPRNAYGFGVVTSEPIWQPPSTRPVIREPAMAVHDQDQQPSPAQAACLPKRAGRARHGRRSLASAQSPARRPASSLVTSPA